MQLSLRTFLLNFLIRHKGPEIGPITLTQRRVFILPTRYGVVFCFLLLLILIGSINYNLSLGYVLTFFLGTMGIISIFHTFRNIAGLSVHLGKSEPVFSGQNAIFTICIENFSKISRHSISIQKKNNLTPLPDYIDAPTGGITCTKIILPTTRRGIFTPGKLIIFTTFPLGIFRAWSYIEPKVQCIVYPKPSPTDSLPPPTPLLQNTDTGIEYSLGNEDFTGFRSYRAGDSPRDIVWKILAREQGLQVKQLSGHVYSELWLDWEDPLITKHKMETELMLSQLTRWILDAEARGLNYGLRLPDKAIIPSCGNLHQQKCLEMLALFK
jgi:uncharacterized protein (DUF58 family)